MRGSGLLSLALAVLILLWLLSGRLTGQHETAEADSSTPATVDEPAPMSVLVRDSEATLIDREVVVQGQLEPLRRVTLRAETQGRVVRIPVRKGARVEAEALLLELAADDRPAQLARAEAELAARRLELAASEKLGRQGLQARTQLKQAQAAVATAEAELARLQAELERLKIRAPFAGIVERRALELGSLVQPGDDLLELVDNARLKAVGQVPQQRAGDLQLGQPVQVRLLDGRQASGQLTYIAQVADPQTRSFRVEAEIPNPHAQLPSGLSAELRIKLGQVSAHRLSPSTLTLNDAGQIGVRAADSDDQVRFHAVTLVRAEQDGVWVSGLPTRLRIITQGQGFVSEGETIAPVVAKTP
jgi:multidrug efflux system membrane fusion protein